MPVMQIGIMRVLVDETAMLVRMAVRFAIRIGWRMDVLMMRIVHVSVGMPKLLMSVRVHVLLCNVQVHADYHQ